MAEALPWESAGSNVMDELEVGGNEMPTEVSLGVVSLGGGTRIEAGKA